MELNLVTLGLGGRANTYNMEERGVVETSRDLDHPVSLLIEIDVYINQTCGFNIHNYITFLNCNEA